MSDEIGNEFDRVLRTALMSVGQLGERVARRQAERQRTEAARLHQAQLEARYGNQQQDRVLREADRVWLDERDAARTVYRPFTNPATFDRATPEQAAMAWEHARYWAGQDPVARESERVIGEAIRTQHGQEPSDVLARATAAHAHAAPSSSAPETVTDQQVHRAVEWAERDAPPYYTRHRDDRLLASDGTLDLSVASRLVQDHHEWNRSGMLSHETTVREWSRHVGRADLDPPATQDITTQQLQELDRVWATAPERQPELTVQDAQEMATQYAPAYYTRHLEPRLLDRATSDQLRADMTALRDTGAVPLRSRQEEWAAWTGQEVEGLEESERTARLEEAWAAGVDERGALELEQSRVSEQDRARAAEHSPEVDDRLRAVYAPHLDPASAREASPEELARSWQAASVVAAPTPGDRAAAEQLHRQFVARHGAEPGQWVRDQQPPGRGREWLLVDVLADRAAEYGDRIDASNAQAAARAGEADATHPDPNVAARGEHQSDVERRTAYAEEATAELWHNDEQRAQEQGAQGEDVAYDRADESDLRAEGVTPDAREAVVDSSHGFSAPTATMVAKAGRTPKNRKARKTATARTAERSADRSRGR